MAGSRGEGPGWPGHRGDRIADIPPGYPDGRGSVHHSPDRGVATVGAPPAGPVIWASVVVGCFVLSPAAAIAAQARKHRVIRTRLGYWALAFLVLSAAVMAADTAGISSGMQVPVTPDVFISAGTIALIAAAV